MTLLRNARIVYAAGLVAVTAWLIVFPLYSHNIYWQGVLFFSFLLAVMASGWNIISGWTGYISLVNWNDALPTYVFVGLRNFARLFETERFKRRLTVGERQVVGVAM